MKEVYIDCEFLRNDFTPMGLVSIGLKCGESTYYAVNSQMNVRALIGNPWMAQNVWPKLPTKRRFVLDHADESVRNRDQMCRDISDWFLNLSDHKDAEKDFILYAWCGSQDLVRLHGLWSHDWNVMPRWIPRYFHDIEEDRIRSGIPDDDLPAQDVSTHHHALADASHAETILHFLREAKQA